MSDRQTSETSWTEPLLLVWPSREHSIGEFITVDGRPAVIRSVQFDSGTVWRGEVEVYESAEAREAANG